MLVDLPEVPLPDWALGVHLLGPLTRESLLFAVYDGLRLGTIVLCVGAANSLANPKRLLRSMPAALYEIGTALVVAVSCCRSSPTACGGSAPRSGCAAATPGGSVGCVGWWYPSSRTPSSARSPWPRAWTPAGTAGTAG